MGLEVRVSRRISRRIEVGRVGNEEVLVLCKYIGRCIGLDVYPNTPLLSLSTKLFPGSSLPSSFTMSALSYKKKENTVLYNNLPSTLSPIHPSTMHHIIQPTEAHTPQAAADPGSDPKAAGEEPDNADSRTPARPAPKP
jgi:hypothetical protein